MGYYGSAVGDYYKGDYYRGDYYRGDPGLLGSIGKGLLKVAKVAAPLASFLPGGGLIAPVLGALTAGRANPAALAGPIMMQQPGAGVRITLPSAGGLSLGAIGVGAFGGSQERGGRAVTVNAAGEIVPRRRRMNPANVRALRRAIRREQAFIALARRSLRGTGLVIHRATSFAHKRRKRG